jgi:phosphoribosylaminoimidazole-succinocarboxamide synthase
MLLALIAGHLPDHQASFGDLALHVVELFGATLVCLPLLRTLFSHLPKGTPPCSRAPQVVPAATRRRGDVASPPDGLPAGRLARVRSVSVVADLPLLASGKVREMYALGDAILMVASDRISTYDAIHPTEIPDKGKVLTGISAFWFGLTADIAPNHMLSATDGVPEEVRGRALTVRRLEMLPVECVVRGYLSGSGWTDYKATGTVCGIALPAGLRESERLPEPIFTPATKAALGDHDENISFEAAVEAIGDRAITERLRERSIAIYERAAEHARGRGIILADTKFEFGYDADGTLTLGDEVLTPDSSRFWPADGYEPGRTQPSFDKQFVRDWAAGTGWDKRPLAPALPDDVVEGTRARYVEAYERIVGEPFSDWLERVAR